MTVDYKFFLFLESSQLFGSFRKKYKAIANSRTFKSLIKKTATAGPAFFYV